MYWKRSIIACSVMWWNYARIRSFHSSILLLESLPQYWMPIFPPCELEPKATQVWAAHEEQAGQEVGGLMPWEFKWPSFGCLIIYLDMIDWKGLVYDNWLHSICRTINKLPLNSTLLMVYSRVAWWCVWRVGYFFIVVYIQWKPTSGPNICFLEWTFIRASQSLVKGRWKHGQDIHGHWTLKAPHPVWSAQLTKVTPS